MLPAPATTHVDGVGLRLARIGAILVSLGTLGFLALNGGWVADNPFLVPDLLLAALLLAGAAVPGPRAVPVLLLGFGVAAGVLIASLSTDAVAGRLSIGSLIGAVAAVTLAGMLLRPARRPPTYPDPPTATHGRDG